MTKTFGKVLREDFPFEKNYIPICHGSFGSYPNSLKPLLEEYRERAESHPDRWQRFEVRELIKHNLEQVAPLLKCSPNDIVFSENATSGVANVLRSFPFEEGDKILCFQTVYANCGKMLEFLENYKKVQLVRVQLDYPLEDSEVLNLTREAIERENAKDGIQKIKLCLLDAISSIPGVCKPYQEMVKLLKEYGIKSLVDGAHAVGQIDLNMEESDPDFFVTNCHKWLFTPRGCAILYVAKRNQGLIHPTSINYAYKHHENPDDSSSFQEEYYPGVMDLRPYLTVHAGIKYRESLGGEEAIRKYTHELAVEGGELVAKLLDTQVMENSTKTLTANMVNVELPIPSTVTLSDAEMFSYFMKKSIYEHNTTLVVYKNNGKWWVRLCAQVYLDLEDFKAVGEILLKLLKELK
ncbi:pyridoxal phosphate-dependent transferase [Sporodiniella umbellata]|nr:pyridoxal phosphate-dependent transferase [Sporodiniella umbellata]